MEKVSVVNLAVGKEIPGAKRWNEERGEFIQIAYQEEIRHLALFEIKKGFSRGNHYHQKKEEIFYVHSGKIKAHFVDLETHERGEHLLEKGDKIKVKPRCGHVFHALEDTLVAEYSPQVYDIKDSYRIDV
jgi:dTDP-4-dehydrorhamnose 3,5-epimerase-like enzyme